MVSAILASPIEMSPSLMADKANPLPNLKLYKRKLDPENLFPDAKKPLNTPAPSKIKADTKIKVILTPDKKAELLTRVFKLQRDENNRIILRLDKEVRKVEKVIYQFFRKTIAEDGTETMIPLDGKTEGPLGKRVSNYITEFNRNVDPKDDRFYNDVRNHTDEIYFKIRKIVEDDEDINEAETKCIKEDDAVNKGYNKNYGGGGGNKFVVDRSISPSKLIEPITPEKVYRVHREKENDPIDIMTTPSVESKINTIYFFKHIESQKRYIGRSTTTLKKRFAKHKSTFNSKKPSPRPLPLAVQKSPNKFVCGVYGTFKEGEDPKRHENHCIKKKKSMVPHGLNTGEPGGGGVSQKFGKRRVVDGVEEGGVAKRKAVEEAGFGGMNKRKAVEGAEKGSVTKRKALSELRATNLKRKAVSS